jgi:small subunit ribosomal protein S20
MPNIKSALKKVRQDERRTAVNERWRRRYREAVKVLRENPNGELYRKAQEELDKAAKRGVIKKGKAARLKSRLSKLINA